MVKNGRFLSGFRHELNERLGTCKFNGEILTGNLNMDRFAVELHSILDGTAEEIYTSPELFLNDTHLQKAVKSAKH